MSFRIKAALLGGVFAVSVPVASSAAPMAALEEIVVTAHKRGQRVSDMAQSVTVLSGETLARDLTASLGETLSARPGISATSFGQAASRPVIRGLGGDRIRVLVNGVGGMDASTVSADHAGSEDMLTAKRVEVLHGPATLLYGGNAIGGVVNVIDGRIAEELPEKAISGSVRAQYETNADAAGVNGNVTAVLGDRLVLTAAGHYLDADAYKTGGGSFVPPEDHDHDHEEEDHEEDHDDDHDDHDDEEATALTSVVPSTELEQKGGRVGLSWVGDSGFFGLAFARSDQDYGVPGHSHEHDHEEDDDDHDHDDEDHDDDDHDHDHDHEEEGHEEGVVIDLVQKRLDLRGGYEGDLGWFESLHLAVGYADYRHAEIEDGAEATVFNNEGVEGHLMVQQKAVGNWSGTVGASLNWRDFEAVGEEAFTPPSTTWQTGAFTVQTWDLGATTLEAGARVDDVSVKAEALGIKRTFTTVSLSGGLVYRATDDLTLRGSVSRAQRAPTAEELFSNGAHLATGSYEVGDATLGKETLTAFEVGLSYAVEGVSLSASAYLNSFDGFVYAAETGAEVDELPVFAYGQSDARFAGVEAEGRVRVVDHSAGSLWLTAGMDYVRATLTDLDEPVPFVPPMRLMAGVEWQSGPVDARMTVQRVTAQDRVAAFETATSGYTLLNAGMTYRPFEGDPGVTLAIEGRNLTDARAYNHVSRIKDQAPLPGRTVRFRVGVDF